MLGISADTPQAQKKFKEKYKLPYTLLADPEKKVVNAFGVLKEKNMYGKKVMGIERTTFVIDGQGRVAHIFPKVKPEGHAEEVLATLKEGTYRLRAQHTGFKEFVVRKLLLEARAYRRIDIRLELGEQKDSAMHGGDVREGVGMADEGDRLAKHLQAHLTGSYVDEFFPTCIFCRNQRNTEEHEARRERLDYMRSR